MEILFIAPLPMPVTGQSIACQVLYENMKYHGYNVTVINLSKESLESGKFSLKRIKQVLNFFRLVFNSRSNKNIIYFTPSQSLLGNLKDLIIYVILFKYLDKTVIHMHGGAGMSRYFNKKYNPLKIINKFFIKRMAAVIVLGKRLTGIYTGMIDSKKIFIAPNFSMPEYYIGNKKLIEKSNSPLKILFLSNLLYGKGHDDLLAAYKNLSVNMQQNITLNFAGAFKDELSKQKFLSEIKNYNNVYYNGVVSGDKKTQLLHEAQIFCLPTYYAYEGQPISILEAYASGCVVMTTNHSGIFDIFTPGENGIEIVSKKPSTIVDAIESIYGNRKFIRKYSLTNICHARRYYTVEKHIKIMNDILFSKHD